MYVLYLICNSALSAAELYMITISTSNYFITKLDKNITQISYKNMYIISSITTLHTISNCTIIS
jgi:hypothetical protein